MTINKSALSSNFKPLTRKERDEQIAFRKWQAVFYTIRTLLWEDSKGRIFRDAIESGVIEAVAPPVKLPDGSLSRAEFDGDDIKELYADAWEKFNAEFDEAFVKATQDEMVDFAGKHFGYKLEDLQAMNAQRSAVRHNR